MKKMLFVLLVSLLTSVVSAQTEDFYCGARCSFTYNYETGEEIIPDMMYATGSTKLGAFLTLKNHCQTTSEIRAAQMGVLINKSSLWVIENQIREMIEVPTKICYPNRLNVCE